MFDPEKYSEFSKILITLILATVLVVPLVRIITKRKSRDWLKGAIEGDNQRLDMNEVWEMIYMFIAVGSFLVLVYMIINKTLYGVGYEWQEYSLIFLGTAGSNGVSAWIIYLKNKR